MQWHSFPSSYSKKKKKNIDSSDFLKHIQVGFSVLSKKKNLQQTWMYTLFHKLASLEIYLSLSLKLSAFAQKSQHFPSNPQMQNPVIEGLHCFCG